MKTVEATQLAPIVDRRDIIKLGVGLGAMVALNGSVALVESAANRPSAAAVGESPANRPVSIDLHTHWAPQAYTKALAELRPAPANPANPLDYDLEKRIQWMDTHGVQIHTLTLNGGMPWQWVPPDVGAHLAQILNDAAVEAHMAHPDRFMAGAELSMADPVLALKELNRVAGKPGIRAVHLPNSIAGRDYLFDAAYEPLLARCEELGYPLLFHPLDGDVNRYVGTSRLADQMSSATGLANSLGFTFESATTAAKFIVSGTLDKHPRLQIVLPHSGGVFPYIAGRIHHGMAAQRGLKMQRPMMEYVRQFHFDSLTFYPETMRFLIDFVGSDRVVIGTDNFAGMDVEYPNALVEELKLPAADLERILRGNAARLLQL